MKFYLLSDNTDTQIGLRLAGIEGVIIHDADRLEKHFKELVVSKSVAVVLITEKLLKLDSGYIKEHKMNGKLPLVVEIPDRHGFSKPSNYILSYVKESVGLEV